MSKVRSKNFDVNKLSVLAPKKAEGDYDYYTCKIKYAADDGFNFREMKVMKATRIDENKRKPGTHSQGFHVTEKEFREMLEEADKKIWAEFLKHKNTKGMPAYLKHCETLEDLKKFAPKFKQMLHYPKLKDADGEATDEINPDVDPILYANMIQNGPNHPEAPGKIWTRYYDEKVLSKTNAEKIKDGKMSEKDFLLNTRDIVNSKHAMMARGMWVAADIFCSDTSLKIRKSVTGVYVQSFEAGESRDTKEAREALEEMDEEIEDGPGLEIPKATTEAPKEGSNDNNAEPTVTQIDEEEFVVQIDQ